MSTRVKRISSARCSGVMSQGNVGANVGRNVGVVVVGATVGKGVVGLGEGADVTIASITSTHTFAHAQNEDESSSASQTWYSKQSRGEITEHSLGFGQLLYPGDGL